MDNTDFTGTVADTAFIICLSRAKQLAISQDKYAQYWVTPKTVELWDKLAQDVYPYDYISSSLRNRFYLERANEFLAQNRQGSFINFAAGFSSLSYLIENAGLTIEIDFANVINYKKYHIEQWQQQGLFPARAVNFFAADLQAPDDLARLNNNLPAWCNKPSFIMMEGITYYLSRQRFQQLLTMFADVQQPGSLLAFEYWPVDAPTNPIFVKLTEYLAKDFGLQNMQYNLLDEQWIKGISGYELVEASDIAQQELLYSSTRVMQNVNNHLPIHFVVLKKK